MEEKRDGSRRWDVREERREEKFERTWTLDLHTPYNTLDSHGVGDSYTPELTVGVSYTPELTSPFLVG